MQHPRHSSPFQGQKSPGFVPTSHAYRCVLWSQCRTMNAIEFLISVCLPYYFVYTLKNPTVNENVNRRQNSRMSKKMTPTSLPINATCFFVTIFLNRFWSFVKPETSNRSRYSPDQPFVPQHLYTFSPIPFFPSSFLLFHFPFFIFHFCRKC